MQDIRINRVDINVPVPMIEMHLPLADNLVEDLCKAIDKYGSENENQTNLKTPMTAYDSHLAHPEEFGEVYSIIASIMRNSPFMENSKSINSKSPLLTNDFWGASYQDEQYAAVHVHGPTSMLSFVYFLKTEDNPAPLLFHPDYLLFGIESDKQDVLGATPKEISCSATSCGEIIPKDGHLIIFPSWVPHSVRHFDPPISEKRYILAGNVTPAEHIGQRNRIIKETAKLYPNVYPHLEQWRREALNEIFYHERPDMDYVMRIEQTESTTSPATQPTSDKKVAYHNMVNTTR